VDWEDEPGRHPRQTGKEKSASWRGILWRPWRLGGQVLAAALLWCGGIAAAEFELNGHALGARVDEVLNDERYDCGGESACFLFMACALKDTARETLHGAPLESLILYYAGERMAAIEAQFAPEEFERVLDTLSRQYGQPQLSASNGGTADDEVYLWRQGQRWVRLERFFAQTGRSSIIIAERGFLGELLGER